MTPAISYTGPLRVHFNRKEEAPRLASITSPDHAWEIICRSVAVRGVFRSGHDLSAPQFSPVWWLESDHAFVEVNADGDAVVTS